MFEGIEYYGNYTVTSTFYGQLNMADFMTVIEEIADYKEILSNAIHS